MGEQEMIDISSPDEEAEWRRVEDEDKKRREAERRRKEADRLVDLREEMAMGDEGCPNS